MSGTIGILSVGAGDTKLTFDRNNPAECIRAARIVRDMLRRGYALLIQSGTGTDGKPRYARAHAFDENTYEYIIADFDPIVAEAADAQERVRDGQEAEPKADAKQPDRSARGRKGGARPGPSSRSKRAWAARARRRSRPAPRGCRARGWRPRRR